MLSNSNTVTKLYISVIDDVIESVRELFQDEGIEERVLDDLRQLWESKVMQSKAVEGFMTGGINPSNFVLQLPANYAQTLHKPTASIVIPTGQNLQNFTSKVNSSGTLATFSLPPGVTYPVQIPAGVTLQTSSGQLYKVSVPVMVTQAPAGNRVLPQPVQHVLEQRDAAGPQGAPAPASVLQAVVPSMADPYPGTVSAGPLLHPPEAQPLPCQLQTVLSQCGSAQVPVISQHQPEPQGPLPPCTPTQHPLESPSDQFTLDGIEFSPQPLDMSLHQSSFSAQISTLPVKNGQVQEGLEQEAGVMVSMADIGQDSAVVPAEFKNHSKQEMDLMRDFNYNDLADVVQLDGVCDSSSEEEEADEGAGIGDDEFLGMINAEALKALQEAEGSSAEGSSSSDSEVVDDVVEEDPLNSGDDVSDQDVPDLFNTDNVVVCQYDKIHRSKNKWKFYLKDGVMSFGGKDYVFAKAVGEAEW